MKKLVSVLLVILMICSCVSVFAHPFTDVDGHWAEQEISNAYDKKIISGDGDGLFRPDDTISRAEFLKIITTIITEEFEIFIPDMKNTTHWANKYYNFASQTYLVPLIDLSYDGVSPGVMSEENFDLPIKRWEMAYIADSLFVSTYGVRSKAINQPNDMELIETTYDDEIVASILSTMGMEIFKGDEIGCFNPELNGTRAESVALISRIKIVIDSLEAYLTQQKNSITDYEKELEDKMITYSEIPEGNPVVKITMEDGSFFKIKLYPEYAPQTCANFLKLVEDKFYTGLTFHRIVEGFVAQGGDPLGTGQGGSERTILGEFKANGYEWNELSHKKGVVSMARSDFENSATSQFFICLDDATFLDGQYAAFGEVIEGLNVVEEFVKVERKADATGELTVPVTPIKIKKAEVIKGEKTLGN